VIKEVAVDRVVEVPVDRMVYNEVEVAVERIVTQERLVEGTANKDSSYTANKDSFKVQPIPLGVTFWNAVSKLKAQSSNVSFQ